MPLLAIDDLAVEFRTRTGTVYALDQVCLHVMRGETVGIVGESGSGKSVLAYAIMGILDPAGRITQWPYHLWRAGHGHGRGRGVAGAAWS